MNAMSAWSGTFWNLTFSCRFQIKSHFDVYIMWNKVDFATFMCFWNHLCLIPFSSRYIWIFQTYSHEVKINYLTPRWPQAHWSIKLISDRLFYSSNHTLIHLRTFWNDKTFLDTVLFRTFFTIVKIFVADERIFLAHKISLKFCILCALFARAHRDVRLR